MGNSIKDLDRCNEITIQQTIIRECEERLPRVTWYHRHGTACLYQAELDDLEGQIKRAKAKLILLGVNLNEESKG